MTVALTFCCIVFHSKYRKPLDYHMFLEFELHNLTLMLLVANLANIHDAKNLKMTEPLAHWYSCESTNQELSNEYRHDRF